MNKLSSLATLAFLSLAFLAYSQPLKKDDPDQDRQRIICQTDSDQPVWQFNAQNIADPNVGFFENFAVILEYASVYDVHNSPDPNNPNLRGQPGHFDEDRILEDLAKVVVPTDYDFVLLYSLQELPGWIWSGNRTGSPAKNIGALNSNYTGLPPWQIVGIRAPWKRLRSLPHMNSVEFLSESVPGLHNYGSTLTAIHEMNHYWGVFITAQSSVGPRNWKPGVDPVAWLASCCAHWTWVWEKPGMPGIMYSGPTSNKFNEFDLYFMGLMGYAEASQAVYQVYEEPRTDPPVLHDVNLDSLVYALSLAGANFYEDNGRRIPDLDGTAQNLRTLVVVVKGQNEDFTTEQHALVADLATNLPADWNTATWGRSKMSVGIDEKSASASPHTAMLVSPDNGAEPAETNISLVWDRSPFAESYRLQVATDANFSNLIHEAAPLTQTNSTIGPLIDGTEYFWRVRAENLHAAGQWSKTYAFTINTAPQSSGLLVTNTNDAGAQSLREAMTLADSNTGPDTILFAIPQTDPGFDSNSGTWTIQPLSPLPAATDSGLVIDGSSQADFIGSDSNPNGPEIVINGQQAGEVIGLYFFSSNNHIKDLVINGFRSRGAIQITADNISGNKITGCYIGTNAAGTDTVPNWQGIYIDRARDTTIGGSAPESRNLISGNVNEAIYLSTGSHHTRVLGNLIGTDITGKAKLGNGSVGVGIFSGSHNNVVGGSQPGERNIISGNFDGVRIWGNDNSVIGNYIGTDITGTEALGNSWDGVSLQVGTNNLIGGPLPGEGNLICANEIRGLVVTADSNKIIGNYIGTDLSGTKDLGNKAHGISLTYGADNNVVGPKNIVAFNQWSGVFVNTDSSFQNTITQNSINKNLSFGILVSDGANGSVTSPSNITFANGVVSGNAPPNSTVEIFSDEDDEGKIYEGTATSDASGNFQWNGIPTGPFVTATATDVSGNTSMFSAPSIVTSVDNKSDMQTPENFALQQNYPNPFNPSTRIQFALPARSDVTLKVYNLLGEEILTLLEEEKPAGVHNVMFDGENFTSGVYFYRLHATNSQNGKSFKQTRKLMLLK